MCECVCRRGQMGVEEEGERGSTTQRRYMFLKQCSISVILPSVLSFFLDFFCSFFLSFLSSLSSTPSPLFVPLPCPLPLIPPPRLILPSLLFSSCRTCPPFPLPHAPFPSLFSLPVSLSLPLFFLSLQCSTVIIIPLTESGLIVRYC